MSMAICSHYTVSPFNILPQSAVDVIFNQLSTLTKYHCSLVCKAWQHVPQTCLYHLPVGTYGIKLPAHQLPLCIHLKTIHISSARTPGWPLLAQQLGLQQLTSLQELHIQHSSNLTQAELLQLQHILQVQGSQCRLFLAVSDKSSLLALLEVLPIQGLVQLDLNTPYLFQGAADMLLQAAALQACCDSQHSWVAQHQQAAAPQHEAGQPGATNQPTEQHCQQQHQQQVFSIGVWVCCWGGCSGIDLDAALAIHQQLTAAGCRVYGCESINCSNDDDVSQLQNLKGLSALGFNYRTGNSTGSNSHSNTSASASDEQPQLADDRQAATNTLFAAVGGSVLNSNTLALSALTSLKDSLQQLTIHGCPPGGFVTVTADDVSVTGGTEGHDMVPSTHQSEADTAAHPLAALTGLTKLSLLKQWGSQAALPLSPLSHLTLLRELAVERQELSYPCELNCLSVLLHLKVLSLTLAVEAEQLQEELRLGQWETIQTGQHEQGVKGASCGVVQLSSVTAKLAGLSVQEGVRLQDDRQKAQQQRVQDVNAGLQTCLVTCTCFSGSYNYGSTTNDHHIQHADAAAPDHASKSAATLTEAAAAAAAHPSELLQQLVSCPCGNGSSPVLLDWSWLRQLTQLEVAWLQVPHLELSCLPPSLVELDAQQPHDLTAVSITCSGSRQSSTGSLNLPNLKRLVLPRTLQVSEQQAVNAMHLMMKEDAAAAAEPVTDNLNDQDVHGNEECVSVSEFSEGWSSHSSSSYDESADNLLQLHHNAVLLLNLSLGCFELRDLQLVQWQLPVPAVVAAAQHMRHLKVISIAQSDDATAGSSLSSGLQRVRDGSVKLELQEQLVLSRYPWSSVLDQR